MQVHPVKPPLKAPIIHRLNLKYDQLISIFGCKFNFRRYIEDVPVEHGLLMENLLDLAHAPFTHTGTFAKGWGVPSFVEFVSSKMRKVWRCRLNPAAPSRVESALAL